MSHKANHNINVPYNSNYDNPNTKNKVQELMGTPVKDIAVGNFRIPQNYGYCNNGHGGGYSGQSPNSFSSGSYSGSDAAPESLYKY